MPNFTTFTKRMVPLSRAPYVTIQRRGSISLNAAAHAELGSPEAVELLYDEDAQIVGFRPVESSVEHAYPVRATNNGTTFMLAGRAFTKYFGIPTDRSMRYQAEMADGVLCVNLATGGTEVTSNRRKAATSVPDGSGTDV